MEAQSCPLCPSFPRGGTAGREELAGSGVQAQKSPCYA